MKKLISRFLVALSAFVPNNCSLAMDELTLNMLSNKELLKQKTERFEGFGWEKVLGNRDTIDLKKVRRIGTKKEVEAILDEYKEKFCQGIIKECKKLDAQNQKNNGQINLFKSYEFTEDDFSFDDILRISRDIKSCGNLIISRRPQCLPFLTYLNRLLLRKDPRIVCRHLCAQLYKAFYDKGLLGGLVVCGFPLYNHLVFIVPYMDGNEIKHWVSDPRALCNIVSDICNACMQEYPGVFSLLEKKGYKLPKLEDFLNFNPDSENVIVTQFNTSHNIPSACKLNSINEIMKMPLENYRQWGHHGNIMVYGINLEGEYITVDSLDEKDVEAYEQDPTLNPYSVQRYFNSIKKIQRLSGKVKYKTRNYSVENKQKK